MSNLIKKVYINSPLWIKEIFANAEAVRRNIYRRSGNYFNYYNSIQIKKVLNSYSEKELIIKFNRLLDYVNKHVPYYKDKIKYIESINDIESIPITDKNLMKNYIEEFINISQKNKLWNGKTSGSTGNPFSYFRDRESMQYEYALYDKLYDYVAQSDEYNKARISGVNIVKTECKKPPFWYFIRMFNQLQCSAYHIEGNTYKLYIDAFYKYRVELGTGYAKAWLFLAQYMNKEKYKFEHFKGIVTDSEGLSSEEKYEIERAFNCQVYQTYGLSEVGMIAIQCKYNHYHIFSDRCYVEVVDADGRVLDDKEMGEIVVTDLLSFNAPYIRYRTGDMGMLEHSNCECGWETPYLKDLYGRLDDYVLTADGRKIGRLSHIAKSAKGVAGMQLIQYRPGQLTINVLPTENFEVKSMDSVIKTAKEYLGEVDISWNIVKELEKTKSGKIRYVIRKI